MLTEPSPYHRAAANLREQGYHVIPVQPGTKVPGEYRGGWHPMPHWTRYCDAMPVEIAHERWEGWPDAGICVAHGVVIGLDLDTDRRDVEAALHAAVEVPGVRKRGAKGWTGYYRPGPGLDGLTARVRWYDPAVKGADGEPSQHPVVELLLHGTQSVLPPTIHPGTGKPYRWITPDTLETVALGDLPVFGGDDLAALDHEFGKLGLTRQAPRRANVVPFAPPGVSIPDLEVPYHRSVNNRALEAEAIDQWFPLLGLPKTKQTGPGRWRAVPSWRASGSGRSLAERNPNVSVHPIGIRDHARDESYTPIDLVIAARGCGVKDATDWLEGFIRPEQGAEEMKNFSQVQAEPVAQVDQPPPGAPVSPRDPANELEWFDDVQPVVETPYIIKGFLDHGAMSVIYGPSNSGKTFFALDVVFHVAIGAPWRDRRVEGGGVLYLAAEGGNGIANRVAALREEYGCCDVPFALRRAGLDLLNPKADLDHVVSLCREVEKRAPLAVVVIDTLSRAIAGGDENAPADMTSFIRNVDAIRQASGAHILIVHHTGKDAAKGARGHSSLRAATDTEVEIMLDEFGNRQAKVTKQRDHEGGEEFHFTLKPVHLGQDQDGDDVTTCVVLPTEGAQNQAGPIIPADVLRRIQKYIHQAWDDGNPISVAPQTRKSGRYGPRALSLEFGLKAPVAQNLLQDWMADDVIRVDTCDANTKVRGVKINKWL